jgi:phosphate transport system permease protein
MDGKSLEQSSIAAPAPQVARKPARSEEIRLKLLRAQRNDRLGRYAITAAGVMVLVSVGTILVFLMSEAFPLIFKPSEHPSGTIDKLLLPQKYEGYKTTQYVWQTEASEGVEEKFGVPLLLWGTIKGALWAMLFSAPLALLSALYVSEFCPPKRRMWVKSSIEVLAGIPTVVVGFFAFVTLSTVINDYYVAHTTYFTDGQWVVFFAQLIMFAVAGSWLGAKALTRRGASKIAIAGGMLGSSIFALAAAWASGAVLCAALGSSLRGLFGVTHFTQLNGILAGFCLGFAIIPILFSVAEDAMRAVPQSHREASLALGGSKWETALRVVLPGAFPGIYAALMLGLARAVGETMIVLMASGNTPILDFSPFTGMRTMSAAIAIEASEKAQNSTGYRVLFFVGALLFLITFVLNAVTDQLIYRLKRRYQVS